MSKIALLREDLGTDNSILLDAKTCYVGTIIEKELHKESGMTRDAIQSLTDGMFGYLNKRLKESLLSGEFVKTYYFMFGDSTYTYNPEFDSAEEAESLRDKIIRIIGSNFKQ